MKKYSSCLFLGLAFFFLLLIAGGFALAQTGALFYGSTGPEVTRLQERLQNWGYFQGTVDGNFGKTTFDAVQQFQQQNGITATGTVDTATRNALGLENDEDMEPAYSPTKGVTVSDDVMLLSRIINAEAKGEPYLGKVAVGAVILNRVESPLFPNTLSGVLFQPGAFQAVSNGTIWSQPDEASVKAANNALSGWDPSYGCLYFWNPATSTSGWIWSKVPVMRVGEHVFAR